MDNEKNRPQLNNDRDEWKTRVYEYDDLRATRRHTWIGTEEEAAEINARKTRIMQGSQPGSDDPYSRFPDMMGGQTVRFNRMDIEPPLSEQKKQKEQEQAERPPRVSIGERFRRLKRSIGSIRIADSRKFKRFLAVAAVFAVLLILEISYFYVKPYVESMPAKTASVRQQAEELEKDNAGLREEIESAADYESKKELKESWERLRDKLKGSVEETSSL